MLVLKPDRAMAAVQAAALIGSVRTGQRSPIHVQGVRHRDGSQGPAREATSYVRVKRPAIEVLDSSKVALAKGGIVDQTALGLRRVSVDWSSYCEAPVVIYQEGQRHETLGETEQGRDLSMLVPCRRCARCLRRRAEKWGQRAVVEWQRSSRTWFGTLTFAPEARYRFLTMTLKRLAEAHIDYETLSHEAKFRERIKDMGPEVTKYLKRLRNGNKSRGFAPAKFRSFLTAEPHKDGTPHYHLLVHEISDLLPIRYDTLQGNWAHGFTNFSLVKEEKAAHYAAKYLGKYSVARVRASSLYGT